MKVLLHSVLRDLRSTGPVMTDREAASLIGIPVDTYRDWLSESKAVQVDIDQIITGRRRDPEERWRLALLDGGRIPSPMEDPEFLCCRLSRVYGLDKTARRHRYRLACDPLRISLGILPHAWSGHLALRLALMSLSSEPLLIGGDGPGHSGDIADLLQMAIEWGQDIRGLSELVWEVVGLPDDGIELDVLDVLDGSQESIHDHEASPWEPSGDPHGS